MSATELARATIAALTAAGTREWVLCPGSRNTPLSLELAAADARGELRLHVRIDERTAGFLALGLAKGSGRPVAVVCTSGTAVANFVPSAVEASATHVPIAYVTANRPLDLVGTGANQTIAQVGIFGDFVRAVAHIDDQSDDAASQLAVAVEAMTASPRGVGPVQIDLGLHAPLVPSSGDGDGDGDRGGRAVAEVRRQPATQAPGNDVRVALPPRALVVVAESSPELADSAVRAALAAGFPVHVEAGSALGAARDGCLRAGAFLLRPELIEYYLPDHVLVVGRPTLSRPIPALCARPDVNVTVVSDDPLIDNPMGLGSPPQRGSSVDIVGTPDAAYAEQWRVIDAAAAAVIDEHTAGEFDAGAIAAVVAATTPDVLVVASSNPIRDLDERAVRLPQRTIVNRGAAGIDGLVSTSIGAALAIQAHEPTARAVALLGDLAFLHDNTGLIFGAHEPQPNLTIVVANNDGGAIFASLEQGAPEYAEHFERVFGTPHAVDVESLCAATSTPYRRCGDPDELWALVSEPPSGIRVIEVPVSRDGERERRAALREAVSEAVRASLT